MSEEEYEVPKKAPGRPKKQFTEPKELEVVEEEVPSDLSQAVEDVNVGSSEPEETVPVKKETAPVKKKKVATAAQSENLAKARIKRLEEIKKYGKKQKETAQKEMEEYFSKKIESAVEARLKAELLKVGKMTKPIPAKKPSPVAKKAAPAVRTKKAAPVAKKAPAKKPATKRPVRSAQESYIDPYADFL